MRLMPIGQHEAHAVLTSLLERAPSVVDRIRQSAEGPRSFAPAMDLALMSQQYVHSRLFRS
jgi:urease accessory protein UreF